ncbi:hypothetical protein [Ochrobactrum chromiisoli]|uniref:Uncharacterized protein n=1 Tax=Ochrobactrum chromiisoli TaxID=2993941 RepID=A0ABT3QMA4_9HYPH|nr:hypothetical protein [Ochrobactrum chromiisoli]MCX2696742.1 hypothetical protein [Ochrobactrum chromiisoli]
MTLFLNFTRRFIVRCFHFAPFAVLYYVLSTRTELAAVCGLVIKHQISSRQDQFENWTMLRFLVLYGAKQPQETENKDFERVKQLSSIGSPLLSDWEMNAVSPYASANMIFDAIEMFFIPIATAWTIFKLLSH